MCVFFSACLKCTMHIQFKCYNKTVCFNQAFFPSRRNDIFPLFFGMFHKTRDFFK